MTDPRFYAELSKPLDGLIKQKRNDAESDPEYLRKAESLVKKMAEGQAEEGAPTELIGKREAIVIYNNLPSTHGAAAAINQVREPAPDENQELVTLAQVIDRAMHEKAPAGGKGDDTREEQVLNALSPLLARDLEAKRAIFKIIKNQPGCA